MPHSFYTATLEAVVLSHESDKIRQNLSVSVADHAGRNIIMLS